uniref:Olfactomedin-like domain-containing protein n=1 Tax=Pundamilia nyererei TaxID=303518 RepID=A0A3B4F048_9CICH
SICTDKMLIQSCLCWLTPAKLPEPDLHHKFDTMQVIKGQQVNSALKADLFKCNKKINTTVTPTEPPQGEFVLFFYVFVCLFLIWWQWESVLRGLEQLIILFIFIPSGTCQRSRLLNVTGPRVYTAGEYPGSHAYGAWGRDPRPEEGKESWYWLVMMTSSNRYSNYVRFYSSLSSLIIGVSVPGNVYIHTSNPTTNTIQGPNNVLYGGALYYNCYNRDAVCHFNLTTKHANFCHLEECYPYTDLDLATDESGVWVVFTTSLDFGNMILSKVEGGEPPALGKTWQTSVYKQAVTNTFMACGVLYATRYVNQELEEIFYSFNTVTGKERFNLGIFISKISPNIQALNYSPVDQTLHVYSDSNMRCFNDTFN